MRQEQFTLSTIVATDPETAFRFLSDYNNHRHLHPYFEKAELVDSGINEEGESYQDFIVTERPFLAFFRYRITFSSRQIITSQNEFRSEVRAAFNTNLVNVMRCVEENGRTVISETITIEAPWLTIRYVKGQAYKAHSRLFELLPTVLGKAVSAG